MDLLSARRESHQTRNGVTYDIRFGDDGVVVEPNDAFNNMMGGMTAPEQTGEDLFGFTGSDVVDTAKAAGRAVVGGVQDAVTGVVGLADDIGTAIDDKLGGGLGFIDLNNGFNYTRSKPENAIRLDEAFDAGLQELGVKVPQGDSPVEAMARGLVQFGAGMTIAPIRGAGYVNTMLRGGFADALFDPEEGNLSTLLKEFGLDGAVLDFLDSEVDDEASAEQRLTARLKQTIEGAGISLPIDFIVQGFKALRSEEGASEIIRNKLTTVKDRLTQPGEMPTVGSNLGNVADFKAPTEKEPGIIAFHGSKNDFNEFKLENIGSGEGAQAFGYGLYFTDSEDIAKFYKDSTTEVPFDYQLDGRSVNKLYNDALNNENYELAEVLEQVQLHDSPKELAERFSGKNGYSEEIQEFVKNLNNDRLTAVNADGEDVPTGRIYKVELAPKEEDLLDYDASFSEQPKSVQNKLLKAGYKINSDTDGSGSMILEALMTSAARKELAPRDAKLKEINAQLNILSKEIDKYSTSYGVFSDPKGKIAFDKYNGLLDERAKLPSQYFKKGDASKIVSEQLSKVGIPGIKYKANRGTGDRDVSSSDPNNYVIFDDKLISILKKYGIVGPVAVTAKSVASNNDEQEGI